MMANEVKAFIAALRDGKTSRQAFEQYCRAKCVLPILMPDVWSARYGQPAADPRRWGCADTFSCEAMAADAFDEGADDEAIAAAFAAGLVQDRADGYGFRTTERDERPSFGDLVRSMSLDDQMKATEFFGIRRVAEAVAGRP